MKNGWMDDRKVDLAIGFPGFSRAKLKTLCVSVVLSGNLNAAFELPFVFGVCDVLSRSQYYTLPWCWGLQSVFATCSFISVSEQPEPPEMYWDSLTGSMLGGSSVGFLDFFFDQWAPAVPPEPQLPWHDFFNNSSCSGRLHPNLAPSILALLPLISSHGNASRTGQCWRSRSEKKSTLSEVACSTDDSKRRPAHTICDPMQQSCMLVFDACLSFTAKHSLRQIFHSVKAQRGRALRRWRIN